MRAVRASRVPAAGQVLNKSDLAAPLGMSVPGIGRWLDILEMTGQIILVPPYVENLGKRLIKSPKLYVADSGLACHLLGIETESDLRRSPFLGTLFEGFLASEIIKAQLNRGQRRDLYYFRDQQGLEVDFIVRRRGRPTLVEAKAGRTVRPEMAASLRRLAAGMRGRSRPSRSPELFVVHQPPRGGVASTALAPGVRALPWPAFLETLAPRRSSSRS